MAIVPNKAELADLGMTSSVNINGIIVPTLFVYGEQLVPIATVQNIIEKINPTIEQIESVNNG